MTVQELIDQLSAIHDDHKKKRIIMSTDEEGNSYNVLYDFYMADYDGEDVYDSGDGPKGSEQVVVFYP